MFMTIALLSLLFFLLTILLLRPSPALSTPPLIPASPPHPRHVSFSLLSTNTYYSPPTVQRRWSSPFHKRKAFPPDPPRTPQPDLVHSVPASPVDQFGRIVYCSPVSDVNAPSKPSRRLSTPLRLSFASKRRSSNASCTSTFVHLDRVDVRTPSPPPSTSETQSQPQRIKFTNLFNKHSRSRTLSPPSTLKSLDMSSSPSSMSSPSSPLARRRVLVDKFKSIFKSPPPETNSTMIQKPIFSTRLRRKPVARTQPYGPPWNASMPVSDFDLSQHSFQKPAQTMSSPLQTSRKRSVRECSRPGIASMSPGQPSPHTFINELDEKLAFLHQQRIQDSITLRHR